MKQEYDKKIRAAALDTKDKPAASDDKDKDKSSSSSGGHVIRDVRDVKHPTGKVPLHIRLMEEYEKLFGEKYCPDYPCEIMDCYLCANPETEDGDVREESAGDAGAQGASASGAGDAGGDAGDGTARPKRRRWKMLVPPNFPQRN